MSYHFKCCIRTKFEYLMLCNYFHDRFVGDIFVAFLNINTFIIHLYTIRLWQNALPWSWKHSIIRELLNSFSCTLYIWGAQCNKWTISEIDVQKIFIKLMIYGNISFCPTLFAFRNKRLKKWVVSIRPQPLHWWRMNETTSDFQEGIWPHGNMCRLQSWRYMYIE